MTNMERLEKHGYRFNSLSGCWLKVVGNLSVSIYSYQKENVVKVWASVDKPTVKEAIKVGEKWLKEMGKEAQDEPRQA